MDWVNLILFVIAIISAASVFFFEDLLYIILLFGAFSIVMALLWMRVNAPDVAITEAAVGMGTAILLIIVMKKLGRRHE
jgi:energy-converting hydrogenase B subunit D